MTKSKSSAKKFSGVVLPVFFAPEVSWTVPIIDITGWRAGLVRILCSQIDEARATLDKPKCD